MITLDNIFENVIAQIIVLGLSSLVGIFFPKLIRKEEKENDAFKVDPLSITIFLTLVFVINFVLNLSFWENQKLTIFFTLGGIVFGFGSYLIYENQCPSCKRFIKAKNKVGEDRIREYTKKIPYQPMKVIKYSNGRIKEKEPFGKKKIRTEKWESKKEFYKCNFCSHEWDSGQIEIPLFREKEEHKVIHTNEKDPEEPSFY